MGVHVRGCTRNSGARNPNQPGGRNYERNQKLYVGHAERGWSSEVQLEAMDVEGLDIAVLFPTRGLHTLAEPNMDPPFAAALARAYNDWMYDFCAPDPDRLIGAAMVSPFDLDDAVAEVERAVKELGFRAVFMRSNKMTEKPWDDPSFDPLWSALEEYDVAIGFHESSSSGARQVGDHFSPNVMLRRVFAQPVEQMMALASFCGGGVLERHPRLRAAFLEANCAWAPWLLWRLDEAYEREGDICVPELTMAPSEYFKRQCWISVEPDEEPAKYAIDWVGGDKMVFSTDYPHGDLEVPRGRFELPEDGHLERGQAQDPLGQLRWPVQSRKRDGPRVAPPSRFESPLHRLRGRVREGGRPARYFRRLWCGASAQQEGFPRGREPRPRLPGLRGRTEEGAAI